MRINSQVEDLEVLLHSDLKETKKQRTDLMLMLDRSLKRIEVGRGISQVWEMDIISIEFQARHGNIKLCVLIMDNSTFFTISSDLNPFLLSLKLWFLLPMLLQLV